MDKKEVLLILTENCNLACTYCFEHHKTNRRMVFSVAKRVIDKEMEMDDGIAHCQLTMFGGEPMLEFDLIKQITEYVISQLSKWNKRVTIFINTNGTLMTPEIKEWLVIHKDLVICGLSLDGTREMHNINRSNSFDNIDLEFYKKYWPQQTVKMTVSNATLPMLAEGVIFIHQLGYECGCTFAYGMEWTDELVGIIREQLAILKDYYVENPDVPICQILSIDLAAVLQEKKEQFKRCGSGETVRAYDTDGKMYSCHAFSPVGLGDEAEKFVDYRLSIDDIHEEERCVECLYHLICPTCYGVNYIYTGSISKRDSWLCKFFKECVKASAEIQLSRIGEKMVDDLTKNDYAILKGIEKIWTDMKIESF